MKLRLAACLLALAAADLQAAGPSPGQVLFVLDFSQHGDNNFAPGVTYFAKAQKWLWQTARDRGAQGAELGLILYGGGDGACSPPTLEVPFGPSPAGVALIQNRVRPYIRPGFDVPLAAALRMALDYARSTPGRCTEIILVAIGAESCNGRDPVEMIKELRSRGCATISVHSMGANPANESRLARIAEAGGGRFSSERNPPASGGGVHPAPSAGTPPSDVYLRARPAVSPPPAPSPSASPSPAAAKTEDAAKESAPIVDPASIQREFSFKRARPTPSPSAAGFLP